MSSANRTKQHPRQSVMQGGGEYDRHARPQAAVVSLGLALARRAAESVPFPRGRAPLVIADYGSAGGRNSLEPVREILTVLRNRGGERVPITVFHNDQPANDFASLFGWLGGSESYASGAKDVFAFASGRSFFERVFPSEYVGIAWSANAAHWLSAAPMRIPHQIGYRRGDRAVDLLFSRQAEKDWRAFIEHRTHELVVGGWLVLLLVGTDRRGSSGGDHYLDLANEAMGDLVQAGLVRSSEYERMMIPIYFRSHDEIDAPFRDPAISRALVLENHEQSTLPDPLWAAFEQTGNAADFAAAHTRWLRGFSEPSLFGALDGDRSPAEGARIADRFYEEIERRAAADPSAVRCRWCIHSVLAKKLCAVDG